jgi:hypothetical protein
MQAKKPPKSLFYNPSMNNAVTHFRHQELLEYIAEKNEKSKKPAHFYLVTDGVVSEDSYGINERLAPWHMEHSLNFLEANGKVRLFKPTEPYSGHIAAVVSDLVPTIMPAENQPVPATNPPQAHSSTDTKQWPQ